MASNNIHLVCSGGGLNCLSYLGAFKQLEENDINIASVSACSMGTVLGSLLCSGRKTLDELLETFRDFDYRSLNKTKSFPLFRQFFYPYARYETPDYAAIMKRLIGDDITLGEMKIPFSAAALDIRQSRFLVYSSETHPDMRISEVVRIATAIPFLYAPHPQGAHLLVDAAVASECPAWMATLKRDQLPIVVLKIAALPNSRLNKKVLWFLSNLFTVSAKSHDYLTLMQTPRSIEVDIPCEPLPYSNWNILKDQIDDLIFRGKDTMSKKLKELDYNLHQTLEVNEISVIPKHGDDIDRAIELANRLMVNYQSENLYRNQVFISYSRKDKEWLLKFQSHLRVIQAFSGVKVWDDTTIEPGSEWDKEIQRALASTKVAVFLVSSNFLSSPFIKDREMKYFLDISEKQKVPILWIAVSSCTYEVTPLETIQCANNPDEPLDQLSLADQNVEFTKICRFILEKMKSTNLPNHPQPVQT